MNIAATTEDLDFFLERTIRFSEFSMSKINFSDQNQWSVKNGALSHKTSGFFHVIGFSDPNGKEQLMLYQPQSALTGLAVCISDNTPYILLQARIEPGNVGIGQYGPTIQSTPANYLKLHGGNETSYLDLFYRYSTKSKPISTSVQLDLGARYFQKSKWHNYILTPELFETEPQMIWVPLQIIFNNINRDNYFNTDLRSLLAVFNWDKFLPGRTDPGRPLDLDIINYLSFSRSPS